MCAERINFLLFNWPRTNEIQYVNECLTQGEDLHKINVCTLASRPQCDGGLLVQHLLSLGLRIPIDDARRIFQNECIGSGLREKYKVTYELTPCKRRTIEMIVDQIGIHEIEYTFFCNEIAGKYFVSCLKAKQCCRKICILFLGCLKNYYCRDVCKLVSGEVWKTRYDQKWL
jgi:hypothetical protein